MPRAMEKPKSPSPVWRAIAVVSTRVWPSMLPPIIIATPTSEIALPNARITALRMANRASLITCVTFWNPVAPSEISVSLMFRSMLLRAEMTSPS